MRKPASLRCVWTAERASRAGTGARVPTRLAVGQADERRARGHGGLCERGEPVESLRERLFRREGGVEPVRRERFQPDG